MLCDIHIQELRIPAHHGVLEQERLIGTDFLVTIDAEVDVGESAFADDNLINRKLVRSELPTDNDSYQSLDHFDPKTGEPVAQKPVSRTEAKQRRRSRLSRKIEETVKKTVSSEKCGEKAAEELIQSGRLRKVYSMRLGYWSRKDGEGKFTLLPVWAIEGELFKNAKAETALKYTPFSLDTLEDRTIVFDAHTGELLKTIDDFPIY